MTQTDFYSMNAAELRAQIAAGNFPPIAGADGEGETPEVPAAAEAPVETPAAEAAETPDESLTEIAQRHADASEQAVETPEEEPAEEPEAATEEVEEASAEEEAEYPEAQKAEDIKLVEAGDPTAEGYDEAVQRLDDVGMIEFEEAEAEEDPEEDTRTDAEKRLDALEAKEQEREDAAAEAAKAREIQEAEDALFEQLDQTFMGEGEQFPRDSKLWTKAQKAQAALTAQFESGEVAKEMLQAYADDHTTKVINEKPDPEDLPNTDGAVTPAKDVEVTPRQAIAAAATREFANRQPVSG